jgi:hypothetical protein
MASMAELKELHTAAAEPGAGPLMVFTVHEAIRITAGLLHLAAESRCGVCSRLYEICGLGCLIRGDTFVACVEWEKKGPRAQVLMSYGNSSQPGTKHDVDQLPLLSEKKLRTAWRLRKDVEANLESRESF